MKAYPDVSLGPAPRLRCPACGLTGDPSHKVDGAVCLDLRAERRISRSS